MLRLELLMLLLIAFFHTVLKCNLQILLDCGRFFAICSGSSSNVARMSFYIQNFKSKTENIVQLDLLMHLMLVNWPSRVLYWKMHLLHEFCKAWFFFLAVCRDAVFFTNAKRY